MTLKANYWVFVLLEMAESQQIDFYDSGYSYAPQDGSGFGYPQDRSGEYYGEYDQTYNSAPGFSYQPTNMMNAQQNSYGFTEQIQQGPADYASFEDEPPLLEGIINL